MDRYVGAVIHVNHGGGFFFIFYEGRRIFCHASQWSELKLPRTADIVSFSIGPGRKGHIFEAIAVKPATSAEQGEWELQSQRLLKAGQ
jgi:cold shock CspA family protein